jgi:prefoldin subunit 5
MQELFEDHERQIEELTAKLEELETTKSRLETRCQILEKAVSIRGAGSSDLAASVVSQPTPCPAHSACMAG